MLATNFGRERTTALALLDVVSQQAAVRRVAAENGELLADLPAVSLEVIECHVKHVGPDA